MTDRRPPASDQFLVAWFEDGPTTMPDRVLDVVADRIGRQRQRRSWRLLGRPFMNTYAKVALAAAAIVIVAVVGYNVLPKSGTGPGGVPSPSPSVVPTPTAVAVRCEDDTTGCLGKLTGGTYSSTNFQPSFRYTVPNGPVDGPPGAYWTNTFDLTHGFGLVPASSDGSFSFQMYSDISIPAQTQPTCDPVAQTGVGNTIDDWVTFLTGHPGLVSTASNPLTIGGFRAIRVDFARADSWTAVCPGSVGPTIITILRGADTPNPGVQWTDDQQESFWLVDVAGETVVIMVESGPGAGHAADVLSAQPVIDSFVFTP